jgi:hypothetical protein
LFHVEQSSVVPDLWIFTIHPLDCSTWNVHPTPRAGGQKFPDSNTSPFHVEQSITLSSWHRSLNHDSWRLYQKSENLRVPRGTPIPRPHAILRTTRRQIANVWK